MRIAAGVLIIVIGVVDLIAGGGYLLGGAIFSSGPKLADAANKLDDAAHKMQEELLQQAKARNAPKAEIERLEKQLKDMQQLKLDFKNLPNAPSMPNGTVLTAFGIFLLVLGGLGIGAGVVLFMAKARIYALIVGILQIGAEIASCLILWFGFWNIPGLIAGIFVVLAALLFYPKGRRARGRDDDDMDDDRPRRRSRRDEEEDEDDRPVRRRPSSAEEEGISDRPRRRRPSAEDEGVSERPRRRPAPAEEEEEEERPRRRRPASDEDDKEERPRRRR